MIVYYNINSNIEGCLRYTISGELRIILSLISEFTILQQHQTITIRIQALTEILHHC